MMIGARGGCARVVCFDDRWWKLEEGGIRPLSGLEDVSGPVWALGDFGMAEAGVDVLNGSVNHAAPLIERRLREAGVLRGVGHVLVHGVQKRGDAHRVLYEAMDVEAYAEATRMAQRHGDHCLLFSPVAVLRRMVGGDGNVAAVFRRGRKIDMLVVIEGEWVGVEQVSAFSESEGDMADAVASLGASLREMAERAGRTPECVRLVSWGLDDGGRFRESLADISGLPVEAGDEEVLPADGARIRTSVGGAFDLLRAFDAFNGKGGAGLFVLDRWTPILGGAALACSLLMLVAAGAWGWQASEMDERIRALEAGASLPDRARAKKVVARLKSPRTREDLKFLSTMGRAALAPDLRRAIRDVRLATPEGVRIIGISMSGVDGGGFALDIDGMSDRTFRHGILGLRLMSKALRSKGYLPVRANDGEVVKLNGVGRFHLRVMLPGRSDG